MHRVLHLGGSVGVGVPFHGKGHHHTAQARQATICGLTWRSQRNLGLRDRAPRCLRIFLKHLKHFLKHCLRIFLKHCFPKQLGNNRSPLRLPAVGGGGGGGLRASSRGNGRWPGPGFARGEMQRRSSSRRARLPADGERPIVWGVRD